MTAFDSLNNGYATIQSRSESASLSTLEYVHGVQQMKTTGAKEQISYLNTILKTIKLKPSNMRVRTMQ